VRKYLDQNPKDDHYLLRFALASDLNRAGQSEAALTEYERCVELEQRFAQGWLNLGEVAYSMEKYGTSAEALMRGFELHDDKPPHVLHYAAVAHIMDQRADRAVPLLERLTSGDHGEPKIEWFRALLLSCVDTADEERGEKAVDNLISWHGDSAEAWYLAFQFYSGMGNYRQASVALTVTSYLRPLTPAEQIQLGDLYTVIEVPEVAAEQYEAAFGHSASATQVERLASAYLAARDMEAALRTLEQALRRQPTPRLWSLLGDLYYMERNYEESYRAFEQIGVGESGHPRASMMMAYCAIELGRYPVAMAHLEYATGFPGQEDRAKDLLNRLRATQP
jgi:tetratricopeptide (TPR) repeat protein